MKTDCNSFQKTFIFLLLVISFIACSKEPDSIGLDLQPTGNKLSVIYTDTCTVWAYTVIDDSLRSDNYSPNLLGSIVDPIFGVTTASIFTQFRLSNNNVSFGTAPKFDSLVLTLPYTGIYNNSQQRISSQHLKVFEVSENMALDSAYYSNQLLSYFKFDKVIADLTFIPNAKDSITVAGVKYPALLRVKFTSYFGNKILHASAANLIDNTSFNNYIKGLFIRTEPLSPSMLDKGSIMYFNLLSAYTNLILYYKGTSNVTDTTQLQYNFLIDTYCGKYNYFDHNGYTNASSGFKNQLGIGVTKDTTLGKQNVYLQAMGGTKVKMKLPFINKLLKDKTGKAQKVTVNEAVLVFQNAEANDYFTPPTDITMLRKLADGSTVLLPDIMEGSTFFDGVYNPSTREYRLRITRYLQQILNSYSSDPSNFIDYGLYLLVDNRRTTANSVMLKGTDNKGIKLELKYNIIK